MIGFARERSLGSLVQDVRVATTTTTLCNGSSTSVQGNFYNGFTGSISTMRDNPTPRFADRSQAGEIINRPMHLMKRSEERDYSGSYLSVYTPTCSGASQKSYTTDWPGGQQNGTFLLPVINDDTFAQLSALAGTQAAANIQPATVTALVEIAELSKTLAMLRNPLRDLRGLINSARRRYRNYRRKFRGKKVGEVKVMSFTDWVQSEWLKYRYGILPLCATVDGILKNLIGDQYKPPRFTARGYAASGESDSDVISIASPGVGYGTQTINRSYDVQYSVRAGVLYEHEFLVGVNRWGTTFADVPPAVWELIPFSFVADWFVNIGDYIRAITPKAGVVVLADWTVRKRVTEARRNGYWNPPPARANFSDTDSRSYSGTYTEQDTVRSHGISVALAFQQITFAKRRDWIHLADAFALLGQISRKG